MAVLHRNQQAWLVRIWWMEHTVHLARMRVAEQAAKLYDMAVLRLFGDDAVINFPAESYAAEMEHFNKVCRPFVCS